MPSYSSSPTPPPHPPCPSPTPTPTPTTTNPPPRSSSSPPPSADAFIFGYGSLCWRPDFPFLSRHPCYISGYQRRFWQGSPDHRGTADAPGRVVTLVKVKEGRVEGGETGEEAVRVYGMVYRVHREHVNAVLDYLDVREQGGYSMQEVTCHLLPSSPSSPSPPASLTALTYLATAANAHYLGDAPLDAIATQIARSVGPSGRNADYLLSLHDWLRSIDVHDDHVHQLVNLVTRIQQQQSAAAAAETDSAQTAVCTGTDVLIAPTP